MMLKLKLQYFGHLMKSWLIGKDSDAGRDWGQEEKGTTEDEMAGREFEWTPGVGLGQRGLACCNSWGRRVGHDWATELNWCNIALYSIRPCFYHQLHPQLGIFALARSPVAYWPPTDMVSSSFSILSFCLFILFMGFSRQEYWNGLPFPSPVDHILSELSTMTRLSWVALHGMAHSFIELDKAVVLVIRLVSFLWLWFSVCLPSNGGW